MDLQIIKFGQKMVLTFQDVSNSEQIVSEEEKFVLSQANFHYIKVGDLPVGFSE